jgi:hypothetical protein
MSIQFPDLRAGQSRRLLACGAVKTQRRELVDWLAVRRTLIGGYTRGKHKHYFRLLTGGKAKHFHLEVALASYFGKTGQPSMNSNPSEVQALAANVMGERIDLTVRAEFLLPFASLAESGPIRVLSAETQVGGSSIQLSAGVLTLKGSRIDEISWRKVGEEDVAVTLDVNLESTISKKYLITAQEMMDRFFTVLVLGDPQPSNRSDNG